MRVSSRSSDSILGRISGRLSEGESPRTDGTPAQPSVRPMPPEVMEEMEHRGEAMESRQNIHLDDGTEVETFSLKSHPSTVFAFYRTDDGRYASFVGDYDLHLDAPNSDAPHLVVKNNSFLEVEPSDDPGEILDRTVNIARQADSLSAGRRGLDDEMPGSFSPSTFAPRSDSSNSGGIRSVPEDEDDETFSVAQINFALPVSNYDDRYAVEESLSEGISQLPGKVDVPGAEQGWSENGQSYSFAVMEGEEPDVAAAQNALNGGEFEDGVPAVDSVDLPVEGSPGEYINAGSKKGGTPSASLGGLGVKGGSKAPASKCGQPVGYNGQPCVLQPGHGGNHRSR